MLKETTLVFVVNKKDGHLSPMRLGGWHNSLKGGSDWEGVEVHTDEKDASYASRKYEAIARIDTLLSHMDNHQIAIVERTIHDNDTLTEIR